MAKFWFHFRIVVWFATTPTACQHSCEMTLEALHVGEYYWNAIHAIDAHVFKTKKKKKNTLHLWLELEPYACALVSATRLIIIKNTKWHYYPFSLSTFFMPNTKRHCGSFGHSLLALRNCFHISWYILIELTSMMIYISQALGLINSTKKESFPRYQVVE